MILPELSLDIFRYCLMGSILFNIINLLIGYGLRMQYPGSSIILFNIGLIFSFSVSFVSIFKMVF
jgi:hypothetical protein